MYGRTLVEGLFGIVPDALSGQLLIRPGLPGAWESASIDTPDVGYSYTRQGDTETFAVRAHFRQPMQLRLRVAARSAGVAQVTANGQAVSWKCVPSIGEPAIEIEVAQADGATVVIQWDGTSLGAAAKRPPWSAAARYTARVVRQPVRLASARLCEVA